MRWPRSPWPKTMVLRRDRPRALRARRGLLFRHCSIPNAKGDGWGRQEGTTPARVTPGAPVAGEREDSTQALPAQCQQFSTPPMPPTGPHATACAPTRCPSRSWANGSIPCHVERGPPAPLVILSQLKVEALAVHPHSDVSNPSPRVSHVRREWRARSSEGSGRVANPTAAWRNWPRWSSTAYSIT